MTNIYPYRLFKIAVMGVDAFIISVSAYLALRVRLLMGGHSLTEYNINDVLDVLPFICVIGLLLLFTYGLYAVGERSLSNTVYSIILTVFMLTVITMALSFFMRTFAYPRMVILISAAFQGILLSVWRITAIYIGRALHGKQTVLVVGNGPEAGLLAKKITYSQGHLYDIKFVFDIGRVEYKKLRQYIGQVNHVFICPSITPKERQRIFTYCIASDTGIFMIPDLFEISVKNAQLQTFDDSPVFRIDKLKLSWEQKAIKRLFDIVFSLLVIIITSPVMLITALVVKITSPGPVIYKQERITNQNRLFYVYKFRTMYVDAEEKTGPVLASENDSRITPVGAFLRAKWLDELPQFFNVLIGDMSVVGPRPERMFFIEQFKLELPDYEYRATVKAGITGYAQVMGKYTTSASDKLRFDLWYIKNYSLWMDITLIMQTSTLMFAKKKGIPT